MFIVIEIKTKSKNRLMCGECEHVHCAANRCNIFDTGIREKITKTLSGTKRDFYRSIHCKNRQVNSWMPTNI